MHDLIEFGIIEKIIVKYNGDGINHDVKSGKLRCTWYFVGWERRRLNLWTFVDIDAI